VQDYDTYEIIFGVNQSDDEAVPVVRRIMTEFPALDIRLVVCSEVYGTNRKVSNLMHLLRAAKYAHVVVNDGDIKVGQNYLHSIMSEFEDPETGMVTCLYRGVPASTLGSRLESVGIATEFVPGVLTAWYLDDGLTFGLGSTLAMSRIALDKIGGFASVVDYLADDYELGARISAAGCKVRLASAVVETAVSPYSFLQFWDHQLRWARTMRISRPSGYRGVGLTFALIWAILLVIAGPGLWWSWALLIWALVFRDAVGIVTGWMILRDRKAFRDLLLVPIRDAVGLAVWICSYFGDTVTWRGEKFRIENGKMYRLGTEINASSSVTSESHRL
jgi:ceramide glucosyltransferase